MPSWLQVAEARGICRGLGGNRNHGHHPRPQPLQGHRPNMALSSRSIPQDTMAPRDHSHQHCPGGGMALRHPHSHRLQSRHRACVWSLMVIWATDTNEDPGCSRTPDPDMVPCSHRGPDVTKVPEGSAATGHSPCGSKAHRHKLGSKWCPGSIYLIIPFQ